MRYPRGGQHAEPLPPPCAWQIAQASASAASGPERRRDSSRRLTISCTCSFRAWPLPTTACFTCSAVYSRDRQIGEHRRADRGAARLAEQQRRLRIDVDEHFFDRDLVRSALARSLPPGLAGWFQPRGERRPAGVADAAAGHIDEPLARFVEHAESRDAQAGSMPRSRGDRGGDTRRRGM